MKFPPESSSFWPLGQTSLALARWKKTQFHPSLRHVDRDKATVSFLMFFNEASYLNSHIMERDFLHMPQCDEFIVHQQWRPDDSEDVMPDTVGQWACLFPHIPLRFSFPWDSNCCRYLLENMAWISNADCSVGAGGGNKTKIRMGDNLVPSRRPMRKGQTRKIPEEPWPW